MSTAIAKQFQVGADGTATNNFTIRQPAAPDGTMRIANGNSGTTTDLVTLTSAGNLGVGTSSPGFPLQIVGSLGYAATNQYTDDSFGGGFVTAKSRGTTSSPSAVLTGDSLGLFSAGGYNSSSIVYNKAVIQMYAAENWTTTANGSYMTFATTANGAIGRSERMRIDSSGNVGIGTSSPGQKLTVGANGVFRLQTGSVTMDCTPTPGATDGFVWNTSASSYYVWSINGSERARIDSSGNLGLGVTPSAWTTATVTPLQIRNASFSGTNSQAFVGNNWYYGGGDKYISSAAAAIFQINGSTFSWQQAPSGTAGNAISFTQAMTLDSSGNLLVGTTSATSGQVVITNPSSTYAVNVAAVNNSGNYYQMYFSAGVGGATVGSIASTSSSTTYATSSDYRLKENIAPMTGALEKVAALKPVTYKWKADGSDGEGFIAHELQEVCPAAVTGEKDAVDKNGKPVYQGIDTSFLVATLTAAIQELKAELDTVKAELQTLKGAA